MHDVTVPISHVIGTAFMGVQIMLVLSRKSGQSVIIDRDITVVVLRVRGSQVKLGITGPKDVAIHRQEVWQKIADQSATPRELLPTA